MIYLILDFFRRETVILCYKIITGDFRNYNFDLNYTKICMHNSH